MDLLTAKWDATAERFLCKVLKALHHKASLVNWDKNPASPKATEILKADKTLTNTTELRQNKYLNNLVDQTLKQSRDGF